MFFCRLKYGVIGLLLTLFALNSWAIASQTNSTLRIHYYRAQSDYSGWGLHIWGDGVRLPRRITWQDPLPPTGVDEQGVYFDLHLQDPARVVSFILHQGDVKHSASEVRVTPSKQGTEYWLLEDDAQVYTSRPSQLGTPASTPNPANASIAKSIAQIKNPPPPKDLNAEYQKKLQQAAEQEYERASKRPPAPTTTNTTVAPPAAVETPAPAEASVSNAAAGSPSPPYYLWGLLILLAITWLGITAWQYARITFLNQELKDEEIAKRTLADKVAELTSEQEHARQQLQTLDKRLNTVFTQSADALLILSIELGDSYRIIAVNRSFCRHTGLEESLVTGRRLDEILTEEGRRGELLRRVREVVRRCEPIQFEERLEFPIGLLMLDNQLTPIQSQPGFCSHVLISARIRKDTKSAQENWQHYSQFDSLTGLANRTQLHQKLTQSLKIFSRSGEGTLAVLIINIDGFRHINDRYGFEIGDNVLQTVAQRLRGTVREVDAVARLGTDEFAVVLDEGTTIDIAHLVAEKVLTSIQRPIPHQDQMIQLSASLGIAIYPEDGTTANNLLKHADMAMRKTKERGGNAFMLYSGRFKQQGLERLALEGHLRRGLLHKEFNFVYQPIFSNSSEKIIGIEALLRWQHPDFGIVLPSQFLSIAESIGNMPALLDWGIKQLATDLPTLLQLQPNLQLSLNISLSQFQHPEFLTIVKNAMQNTAFKKDQLVFDLAESTLLSDASYTEKIIKGLNLLGVSIAIDNFGLGPAGFSVLKRFAAQSIKLERSLISEVPRNPQSVSTVQSIVLQAKALNMAIIAKGIEEADQKEFMQKSGCFGLQGNFLGKPFSADQLLASYKPNRSKTTH